jgi:hypothetical protein
VIIPADLYLDAVAFVRSRIRCETIADVNRAEARMLNRMRSTPPLRKFKAAFLQHFDHRQRAGINLMRTLYARRDPSDRSLTPQGCCVTAQSSTPQGTIVLTGGPRPHLRDTLLRSRDGKPYRHQH